LPTSARCRRDIGETAGAGGATMSPGQRKGERMDDIAPSGQRLAFIDNLRWSAISMVVVMHAAVTYSPFGSWYYREHPALGLPAMVAFATYQSFQHAVSMGLLFGIAGYFAAGAVARKGVAGFLRERCVRLGVPLLFYMLILGPLTEYFIAGTWVSHPPRSFAADWLHHVADGAILDGSGPLWFCLVLLLFSACFAVWRMLRPAGGPGGREVPGVAAVGLYAVAMAAVTFTVGLVAPGGGTVLNVDIHDFPQYPLMFAAGTLAWRHDWPRRIAARAGRWWLVGGLLVSGALWVGLVTLGGALDGQIRAYGGGWHWQAAGMDLWRSFTCLALSLGLVTLYRDRFAGQGPVARFLTRNAFGVYVFHAPILIAVTRALHAWPADVAAKFLLASVAAIVGSFLFVGLVARRTPVVRAML
jgi:peptidoglycan/LPS O-acetylase OafA/YrhL